MNRFTKRLPAQIITPVEVPMGFGFDPAFTPSPLELPENEKKLKFDDKTQLKTLECL